MSNPTDDDPEIAELTARLRPSWRERLGLGFLRPRPQSTEEWEAELIRGGAVRRHWRKPALAVPALGVVWAVTLGGSTLIEQAEESDTACSNRDYADEPGASRDCEGRAGLWLLLAKISLDRTEAIAADLAIRRDAANRALTRAVEVDLDPAAREEAIDRILAVSLEPGWSSESRTADYAFSAAAGSGSREGALRLADHAKGAFDLGRALSAAIALGDLDGAERVARRTTDENHGESWDLRRGAFLCLRGHEEEGRAVLTTALERRKESSQHPYVEAQIALYACKAPPGSQKNELYAEALVAAEVLAAPGEVDVERYIGMGARTAGAIDSNREPLVVHWLLAHEQRPEGIVEQAATLRRPSPMMLSPWIMRHRSIGSLFSSHPTAIDVEAFERAASTLETLHARVETGEVTIEPFDDDERFSRNAFRYNDLIRAARAEPLSHLATGAQALRLHALLARLSTGQSVDEALLNSLEGEERALYLLSVASAALFRADVDTAARRLAALDGVTDPTLALIAAIHRALVEMHRGNSAAAHEASGRALELVGKTNGAVLDLFGAATRWLRLATAIAVGRPSEAPTIGSPQMYEREATSWNVLVTDDATSRRDARFRMFTVHVDMTMRAVFPAVLYVLYEVADDGADPDVWLDNLLPLHTPDSTGITAMRARAEAARWRGDGAREAHWKARAAALEPLLATPRGSLLARLAGVDG